MSIKDKIQAANAAAVAKTAELRQRQEELKAQAAATAMRVPGAQAVKSAHDARAEATPKWGGPGTPSPFPLFVGESHEDGRNATVTLWHDRLERVKHRKLTSMSSASQDTEVTPVRAMTSVQATKDGIRYTKVTVYASGNNIDFRFGHEEAVRFKNALGPLLLAPSAAPVVVAQAAAPDLAEQLARLAALRDQGILTDEEFAAQKVRLLA